MDYVNVNFVISVGRTSALHSHNLPEIAVAGKSNVGKSSIINMLAGRKKLAKVSAEAGKTRLINYFDFDGKFMLVDLPGYGFAKVSKEEKQSWGALVENYLNNSKNIKRVLLLLDSRHLPTADDLTMINYMYYYAIPFSIVLTKTDKLSRNQLMQSIKGILEKIKLTRNDIYITSAETRVGKDELLTLIDGLISE